MTYRCCRCGQEYPSLTGLTITECHPTMKLVLTKKGKWQFVAEPVVKTMCSDRFWCNERICPTVEEKRKDKKKK